MTDEKNFLDALQADPHDTTTRLVYADWLEEQGDPRAEFLRLQVEIELLPENAWHQKKKLLTRLNELRPLIDIDSEWRTHVDTAKVEGCFANPIGQLGFLGFFRFKYECPQRWINLQTTEDARIRFCNQCQKQVFYCDNLELAQRHVNHGHCVAVDSSLLRRKRDLKTDPQNAAREFIGIGWGDSQVLQELYEGDRVRIKAGPHRGAEGSVKKVNVSQLRATIEVIQADETSLIEADFEELELDFEHRYQQLLERWNCSDDTQ